jgi:hypothetical protein
MGVNAALVRNYIGRFSSCAIEKNTGEMAQALLGGTAARRERRL